MPKTGKTQTFQTQSVMHLSLSACWPALTIAKFLCSFIFLCLFKQEVCWGTSVSPSHNFSAPERFSWVYCGADEEILWPSLNICMDLGLDYGAQTKHPALESVSSTPISCCFSPLFFAQRKTLSARLQVTACSHGSYQGVEHCARNLSWSQVTQEHCRSASPCYVVVWRWMEVWMGCSLVLSCSWCHSEIAWVMAAESLVLKIRFL